VLGYRIRNMRKILAFVSLMLAFSCYATTITAKSWLVYDEGKIIDGENMSTIRSIASITKLITVMTFLDAKKNVVTKSQQDLIQRTLVSSDNTSADLLCKSYPGGRSRCINDMNRKVKLMGLKNTRFLDPTGLSMFNVSTAKELIEIVKVASQYPEIVKSGQTLRGNTNSLVGKYDLTISKTGFINMSGGCIVMMYKQKIVVILGSKNTRTRIPEAEMLLQL